MRPFILLLTLLVLLFNSQLYSKTWADYPAVKDMSNMTEYAKADMWLNERGEVDLVIYPDSPLDLKPLVNKISIIHVESGKVLANADRAGFEKFLEYGFDYEVQTPVMQTGPVPMSDYAEYLAGEKQADWYHYPTYSAYVGFLEKWEDDYPEICKMYDLGPSGRGSHHVYAMRISDNVSVNEPEPRYLETNVIHGDEVLNMMNCLHMIDTTLTSYGKVDRFTKLVDSLEMWFIPLMNPDATYLRSDNTVGDAQRRDPTHNWDLNRNNPCPCGGGGDCYGETGLYPSYAAETVALMGLHSKYKFPFAQDQHGGTETYLWPYGGVRDRGKDEDWYRWLCGMLVDQIHEDCNNNGYMTSCGGDGIGHIYTELYECHGIRCDMNDYVGDGKSVTLESSVRKLLDESDLQRHWNYCREALLMSYEAMYKYGLHGIVTDSITGEPIFGVSITRNGDTLTLPNNRVYGRVLTDSCGRYLKYMNRGTYTLTFYHEDYQVKRVQNVQINSYTDRDNLNVKLWDGSTDIADNIGNTASTLAVIPFHRGIKISNVDKNADVSIYTITGKLVRKLPASASSTRLWKGTDNNGRYVSKGCYIVKMKSTAKAVSRRFVL